ncbi:MAG: hypothetical protein JW913_07850 [Chitinispirillaceae bacterium]|nr:hypothetical protein [Chitinispirillaceae bacterium]
MNRHENNKFLMYGAAQAVCKKHRETIDSMPPLVEAVKSFDDSIPVIVQRDNEYVGISAGAASAKNAAYEVLYDKLLQTKDALFVYGRKSDNEQLKAECGISHSDVKHLRENTMLQLCVRIAGLAKTYAKELEPYGITAGDIESLEKAMDQYNLMLDDFQQKTAESKGAREMLYQAFQYTDEILKKDIDTMVGLLRTKDIDFYNEYQAARTIKDYGQSRSSQDETEEAAEPKEKEDVAENTPA